MNRPFFNIIEHGFNGKRGLIRIKIRCEVFGGKSSRGEARGKALPVMCYVLRENLRKDSKSIGREVRWKNINHGGTESTEKRLGRTSGRIARMEKCSDIIDTSVILSVLPYTTCYAYR